MITRKTTAAQAKTLIFLPDQQPKLAVLMLHFLEVGETYHSMLSLLTIL